MFNCLPTEPSRGLFSVWTHPWCCSLLIRTLLYWIKVPLTGPSFNLPYFFKGLSLNTGILRSRVSTCEFWKDTIQFTTALYLTKMAFSESWLVAKVAKNSKASNLNWIQIPISSFTGVFFSSSSLVKLLVFQILSLLFYLKLRSTILWWSCFEH